MRIDIGNDYIIRSAIFGDAIHLAQHGDNPKVSLYMRNNFPSPYTVEQARYWINHIKNHEADNRFIIAYNNEAIGEIGFSPLQDIHRFSAEIGFWISENHWGKGVTTKAVKALCEYVFENTNIIRLFADVHEHNHSSCKLLKKCNFELEAVLKKNIFKNQQFFNQYIFVLLKK